ncbi:MAG: hypothetical protein HY796_11170 [Elusimicrobia bacterium]|nr:hypothetical protein [Elusimicrobiota bacterium]
MKRLLIYGINLTILACALVLSYKYVQGRLNPKQPALPPSKLENCQNLEINDLKLIAFANKCLLEYGKDRIAYASARNINDITCPKNITDFNPPEIKRFTEAEKKRAKIEVPDEWTVWYRNKKGYMGGAGCRCRCSKASIPGSNY